jgi:hypothetical protein
MSVAYSRIQMRVKQYRDVDLLEGSRVQWNTAEKKDGQKMLT